MNDKKEILKMEHQVDIDSEGNISRVLSRFLVLVTEASYRVAAQTGFRGSLLSFLHDFESALDEILREEKMEYHVSKSPRHIA